MTCQAPDRVSCVQGSTIPLCFFLNLQKDFVGGGAYNQVDLGFIPRIHVNGCAWQCMLGSGDRHIFGAFWLSKLAYLEYERLCLKKSGWLLKDTRGCSVHGATHTLTHACAHTHAHTSTRTCTHTRTCTPHIRVLRDHLSILFSERNSYEFRTYSEPSVSFAFY